MSRTYSRLQVLFDHMIREHDLVLTDSELNEIVHVVEQHKPVLTLRSLEESLVHHGVIQADAIADAGGYDGGRTRDLVLKVYEDLIGMGMPSSGVPQSSAVSARCPTASESGDRAIAGAVVTALNASNTPDQGQLRKWQPGDRVTRLAFMDDGTWAREGDSCLSRSPRRPGVVVKRDTVRSDAVYVQFDDAPIGVRMFLDHGLQAEA